MDTGHFLLDIGLALLLAAAFGWVARKLGLPAVVGYLAAGLAVSPFTPGYVADRHQIELLAEVGRRAAAVRGRHRGRPRPHAARARRAPVGVAAADRRSRPPWPRSCCSRIGLPPYGAALVGLSVAMSSSVVVVNITRSRRRTTDKPTDEGLLGWSVLQDVTGVALGTVIIADVRHRAAGRCRWPSRCSPPTCVLAVVAAQVLPLVLRHLRSEHDLFLIVSVASGLALAAAGAVWFGVPAALAAFVGGLAISNRAETAEARRRLLPFRDVFAVLFFVAVGTLIDPSALPGAVPEIALLVGDGRGREGRAGLGPGADRPARRPPAQLAVGLGQMGEFGYVLAGIGLAAGAVSAEMFTAVLSTIVVTIAGSAILVRFVGKAPARAELDTRHPTAGAARGRGLVDDRRVGRERERERRRRQRRVGHVAGDDGVAGDLAADRLLEPEDHAVGAVDGRCGSRSRADPRSARSSAGGRIRGRSPRRPATNADPVTRQSPVVEHVLAVPGGVDEQVGQRLHLEGRDRDVDARAAREVAVVGHAANRRPDRSPGADLARGHVGLHGRAVGDPRSRSRRSCRPPGPTTGPWPRPGGAA